MLFRSAMGHAEPTCDGITQGLLIVSNLHEEVRIRDVVDDAYAPANRRR